MIYTVILDKSAPILGCLQTEFYSTYGLGFTVSASDDSGSVKLYYKTPSSRSYVLAERRPIRRRLKAKTESIISTPLTIWETEAKPIGLTFKSCILIRR